MSSGWHDCMQAESVSSRRGRAVQGTPRPLHALMPTHDEPRFAHGIEAALARVFDAHRIVWLYEPHTFALEHAADGRLTRAFTPDFFLPEIGIYLECTVARRSCTTRKRQKARAAERLHGIVVEIAYRADFEYLARRWSLRELAGALEDRTADPVERCPPVVG